MSTGYPDYARLSQAGGSELATVTGAVTSGQVIFQGFVGSWPFLYLANSSFTPNDNVLITITYYSDATFGTMASSQGITRSQGMATITVRAVLGPWCKITVTTASGAPVTFGQVTIYGSYARSSGPDLHSGNEVAFQTSASVAGGATSTFNVAVTPKGSAVFMLYSPAGLWAAQFFYYSWAAAAVVEVMQLDNSVAAHGGVWTIPFIDAPYSIHLTNRATAAQVIVASLTAAAS